MDLYETNSPYPKPTRVWHHGQAISWAVLGPDEYSSAAEELFEPTLSAFMQLLNDYNDGRLPRSAAGRLADESPQAPPGAIGIEISQWSGSSLIVQVCENADGDLQLFCKDASGVVRYDNGLQASNWFMARLPEAYQRLLPKLDLAALDF